MTEFHAPGWHGEERTPVVDGKYIDRATGDVKTLKTADVRDDDDVAQEYMGPPSVDVFVMSIHDATSSCAFRAARAFTMEVLLANIMKIVAERGLALDSVVATTYSIRVILADDKLTPDSFSDVALAFVNDVFE
ncbi:hypothetical protein F503_08443 [Ophiostoma piceae UAMH 11346]|uniref:Uncharacterized protein n=1 Tax=Ophiostoma piceae (strain UAMH 11346) TaxID=1262450 RepID=S3BZF9_OPHP1|nr:hypothetical protein F503_08443 [Ophiostoma piceae UAMH 11346]